jgi:transposase
MNKKINIKTSIQQEKEKDIIVSLDLHDYNIYMAALNIRTGEVYCDKNILGSYPELLKELNKLSHLKDRIIIIFEAGSHGFYPCRILESYNFDYRMIAPHSIPVKHRQATDKIDTWENLKDYRAGNLRFVTIPKQSIVDARDLLRKRFKMVTDVVKVKNRIVSHVKRHGHIYTQGSTKWTKRHRQWISQLPLNPTVKTLLKIELRELEENEDMLTEIDGALNSYIEENSEIKKLYMSYTLIRGIGPVCGKILVLEGGDFSRFSHPRKLMSFTGLVPGLSQSGIVYSPSSCPITKQGNKYLRYAFVCASKMYLDFRCMYSKKELKQLPEILSTFITKCQKRLYFRYGILRSKGKHRNKIKCAIARELCAFIWEYTVKIIPYIEEEIFKNAA